MGKILDPTIPITDRSGGLIYTRLDMNIYQHVPRALVVWMLWFAAPVTIITYVASGQVSKTVGIFLMTLGLWVVLHTERLHRGELPRPDLFPRAGTAFLLRMLGTAVACLAVWLMFRY